MRNIWTIASREYRLYFASPAAYLIMFMILLVLGIIFFINLSYVVQTGGSGGFVPDVRTTLVPMATLLMLATPAVTTRLLAEEQRMGTIELLLTAPVRDAELVVGKWLGAFLFMLTIVAVSLVYPILLNTMVDPGIDQGLLISGYLGILLLCAALAAVGVWISSLFSNQIAAFATTLGVLILLWWIISPIGQVMGPGSIGATIVGYLDMAGHFFTNLSEGIVDLRDVTYFLSLTALGLFLGTMTVETRRWR
jgi:ABC-2 type transport system permease protein